MTEGPRVNFVMREALFEIYTWILCLSHLHEKQTSRLYTLSKLSRFGHEISVFNTGGNQNSRRNGHLIHLLRVLFGGRVVSKDRDRYVTYAASWKNGCQIFSYVHRSIKH